MCVFSKALCEAYRNPTFFQHLIMCQFIQEIFISVFPSWPEYAPQLLVHCNKRLTRHSIYSHHPASVIPPSSESHLINREGPGEHPISTSFMSHHTHFDTAHLFHLSLLSALLCDNDLDGHRRCHATSNSVEFTPKCRKSHLD